MMPSSKPTNVTLSRELDLVRMRSKRRRGDSLRRMQRVWMIATVLSFILGYLIGLLSL